MLCHHGGIGAASYVSLDLCKGWACRYFWLDGTISPGPDYRLYLAPEFVDDGAGFLAIKAEPRQTGAVKTFENFALDLTPAIDLDEYDAVLIWCEAFKQFITAARLEN
jgi:hypothetical protein